MKLRKRYRLPGGQVYTLFDDMAKAPHLLIAGATGSGKSVVENGVLFNLLHAGPGHCRLILIDPKRTELRKYVKLPHVLDYADTIPDMISSLRYAKDITDQRYQDMQRRGLIEYDGSHVYVIIDELAALMTTAKKQVLPILQYLGMVSRAARVHVIACTQTVKADVLPTTLTCNFDARVALRTSTAQQSRMLVDTAGCERFPSPVIEKRALCFFRNGSDLTCWNVPKYTDSDFAHLLHHWTSRACWA